MSHSLRWQSQHLKPSALDFVLLLNSTVLGCEQKLPRHIGVYPPENSRPREIAPPRSRPEHPETYL